MGKNKGKIILKIKSRIALKGTKRKIMIFL